MSTRSQILETRELALFANRLRDTFERTGIDISPGSEAVGQLMEGIDELDDLFVSYKERLDEMEQTLNAVYQCLFERGYVKDRIYIIREERT